MMYDNNVKEAMDGFGVHDVYNFFSIENNDLLLSFEVSDHNSPTTPIITKLHPITIGKICSLQQWNADQQDPYQTIWFQLTPDSFNQWRSMNIVSSITASGSTSAQSIINPSQGTISSFHQNIKINISDYPKLKEDSQSCPFDSQL
jgi:hypothetical protein